MEMPDIGIGIVSFDRPGCVRRLLASLEQQADLDGVDFHLYQDGAVNRYSDVAWGDPDAIAQSVRAFERAQLPRKTPHLRDENVGVGINQYEAYEFMADKYEWIVMLEDDVVLSPHWLHLVRVLFGELEQRPDVFGFSTGFKRTCGIEQIGERLDRVEYGWPHWWCIAFTADRWRRIRPYFLEYHALIEGIDYTARDHSAIRDLFRYHGWPQNATSQDGGKDMAVHAAGMRRAVLTVNRGISTGRHGMHFNPKRFKRMGFEGQTPYIFGGDAYREAFQWPVL